MSCSKCENKSRSAVGISFACLCDTFMHPLQIKIDAGLDRLPRQIAGFPEFRRAMLRSLKSEKVSIINSNNVSQVVSPLENWRARDKDDLGIMLIEMWAYVCDSLSFYDEVLANESYIRTALLKPAVRKLVDILGYIPTPAIGSAVQLAAIADGRIPVVIPKGTAFRSGAFNGNPPQVFETDEQTVIHPFTNRFGIAESPKDIIESDFPESMVIVPRSEIAEDSILMLVNKSDELQNSVVTVRKVEQFNGKNNLLYTKVIFKDPSLLKSGTSLQSVQLLKPIYNARLWTTNELSKSAEAKKIVLNILSYQVQAGEYLLMIAGDDKRWFKISEVEETTRSLVSEPKMVINGNEFEVPGVAIPLTALTLDVDVNDSTRRAGGNGEWATSDFKKITVYFGMQPAADITDEPNDTLVATDDLLLTGNIEKPENYDPSDFLFQDKNTSGVSAGGKIRFQQKRIELDPSPIWTKPLVLPVNVFGNVLTASRGETVNNEKMGSGNSSVGGQTFKLKKKPLTYHLSPSASDPRGIKNSLRIYVDGIKWDEVMSFYGKNESDQVYIVRQNDEGVSIVTFGDGIRGQRLPSGTDNIICSYRFGGEAAVPPGSSVSQIATPVKGLQSIKNILPAFGGDDAEPIEKLRTFAPRSALILGRVVSIRDMEALAAGFPGVRAVQAEWRWDKNKQRASAHIYYIGADGINTALEHQLRGYSDPTTPITVEQAESVPLFLSLNIKINSRFNVQDVARNIRMALLNNEDSLLRPEHIGIGTPLYRSRIFKTALGVKGADAVQSLLSGDQNFPDFAMMPGAGRYFDVEAGKLIINGFDN